MQISFKSYKRRDGSMMLYINRSNGVSIGISAERGFSPYGKDSTEGKRNAFNAAFKVIRDHGKPFTGTIENHKEEGYCAPVKLSNGWVMIGTDTGNIGGMPVGEDGGYIIADGQILKMNVAYDESSE